MHLEITNWITIPVENLPAIDFRIGNTNISYLPDAVNGGYCGSMVEKDDAGWDLRPSLVYIYAFGDIDEVAGRITDSGGHILSIKTNVYPEEGIFIIFEDTEANKIAFVGLRASQAQKHSA